MSSLKVGRTEIVGPTGIGGKGPHEHPWLKDGGGGGGGGEG